MEDEKEGSERTGHFSFKQEGPGTRVTRNEMHNGAT